MHLSADGRLWVTSNLYQRVVEVVVDSEHFMVNGCTIFTLFDVEARTTKILCVVWVTYVIFVTIAFQPVEIDAPVHL